MLDAFYLFVQVGKYTNTWKLTKNNLEKIILNGKYNTYLNFIYIFWNFCELKIFY